MLRMPGHTQKLGKVCQAYVKKGTLKKRKLFFEIFVPKSGEIGVP